MLETERRPWLLVHELLDMPLVERCFPYVGFLVPFDTQPIRGKVCIYLFSSSSFVGKCMPVLYLLSQIHAVPFKSIIIRHIPDFYQKSMLSLSHSQSNENTYLAHSQLPCTDQHFRTA
jgi:hypothetical protein